MALLYALQHPSQLYAAHWPHQQQQLHHLRCRDCHVAASKRVRRRSDELQTVPAQLGSNGKCQTVVQALQSRLANVNHMFTGATSAQLQGVCVPRRCTDVEVCVQWDSLKTLHAEFIEEGLQPGPIQRQDRGQMAFSLKLHDTSVVVQSHLNTVLRMDPDRVTAQDPVSGKAFWCESLLSVKRGAAADLAAAVEQRLQQLQQQMTAANAQVWSQSAAASAWVEKLGAPEETAVWICQDPWLRLGRPLYKHMPQTLSGVKLINLMGSHGTKAVAAAALGAHVTCVDISPVNATFCAQVAAAAGVEVHFVVSDVLHMPPDTLNGTFDIVLLEQGVLHYFLDLAPLLAVVQQLLSPGGKLLLREFHPVSTKLITSTGKKHKVVGDYFKQALVRTTVAYNKYALTDQHSGSDEQQVVQLRQWTLGEVVTAVCAAGLVLHCLEEEPGVKADDAGLPKVFTLVASKSL